MKRSGVAYSCSYALLVSKVSKLARFAKTQPHAAHAAFTHDLSSEWTYLSRSVQTLEEYLKPLEDVIRRDLLPLLRDGRSVTSSGFCSASQLVSEEWPCATRSMKHGHISTWPLRPLLQWCTTSVALMKSAVTSWRPLAYSVKNLSWARKEERLRFRRRRMASTAISQRSTCHVTCARKGCIDQADDRSDG